MTENSSNASAGRIDHGLVANVPPTVGATRARSWIGRAASALLPTSFLAAIGLGVGLFVAPQSALAIVPVQYQCSATYDASRSWCAPVEVGEWRWYITPGFGRTIQGPYESEAAAIAHAGDTFSINQMPSDWCSLNSTGVTYNTATPSTYVGFVSSMKHRANFTIVSQVRTGCGALGYVSWQLEQKRSIRCPAEEDSGATYSLITDAGTPGTPYCAIPWTAARKLPRCSVEKGNPCDLVSGYKVLREVDYGSGAAGVPQFVRQYSSATGFTNFSGTQNRNWHNPLGVGWYAPYFQRLRSHASGTHESVTARRPDGRSILFVKSGANFVPDANVPDRLTKLLDGSGQLSGYKYVTDADETETYDPSGRLISIRNRNGVTETISYASPDTALPASVTGPFGHQLMFTYHESMTPKMLATVTLPGGGVIRYGYDSEENLTSVTYPDLTVRTYHYPVSGTRKNLLLGITDESGTRFTTYTYDTNTGRLFTTERAGGVNKYTFSYSGTSRTVTDPLGKVRTYNTIAVAGSRYLVSSSEACAGCNEPKLAAFDPNGNRTSRTDFNNVERRATYDTTRNLETSRTEAFGTASARTTTTQWNPNFRVPTVIESSNRRITFTHDADGNVLSRTVTDLNTSAYRSWSYTYDSYGRLLTENGPRTDVSDVTTYTYNTCTTGNGCGALATITNALGHVTTFNSYNSHGQPLQVTDPNGTVTTLTYDSRQRLLSRTVAGESTSFTYWPTGLLRRVTEPSGAYLEYTYDAAQRLVQIADTDGNRIAYTLDAMGNRTAEQVYDPGNVLTRAQFRTYDLLNRLTQDIGAANTAAVATSFTYDGNNNPTQVAAPLARTTANVYDALNRLKQTTDPALGITQYGYNANDELTSVTDPKGLVTSYTYNGLGDRLTLTSPDTGVTSYTYDSAGNMATSTDARGKLATYSYDALNRVTQIVYASQIQTFGYDSGTNGKGRLTGVTDSSGSTAWTYDPLGRVTNKTQVIGALSKTIAYGYNAAGQLATITYPSGVVVTYAYTNGKVTSITSPSQTLLSGILYEPFGPVRGWLWGNGTPSARVFDQDGRPTQIDSAGLRSYTYDNASRISAITDDQNSALSWTYGYDANDRLTSANSTSLSQSFTFDANGNRLTQGGSTSVTLTPATTSNRLMQTTGSLVRTYSYDAAGNTLSDGTTTFTYSDAGRMLTATKSGLTTAYAYNALGQRVKKSNTSAAAHFVYDEAGRLLGEYDATGAVRQEFIWLGDTPVAVNDAVPTSPPYWTYYLHTDHLNTIRRVTRILNPTVVWSWDSDAFGTTAANEDPDGDTVPFRLNLRFPGQYFDAESGLHYNYFRDYDAVVGRYAQSDPVGLFGGVNTYLYADSNPAIYIDPLGLWSFGDPLSQGTVDAVAAFGDTLSFGLTDTIRDYAGWNNVVNQCSADYQRGENVAAAYSLAFGAAHLGRAALNQGIARVFVDPRKWGSVQRSWSRSVGGYRGRYELHHWFSPQSAGGSNAGWNYIAVSGRLNRAMSNGGVIFNVFRATVISIYGAVPTAIYR